MSDDYIPPAIDGCSCLCHRQPGVMHFMACCGTGSIPARVRDAIDTLPTTSGDVGKLCKRLLALDDETMCFDGNATYALIHEAAARIAALEKALEPFARLQLPVRADGNAGFHSILHGQILNARALLSPAPTSIEEA